MESYERFRKKIDEACPFPTPSTESKVELEILSRLMTPEEAEIACHLSGDPETAQTVAARAGISAESLHPVLEELVRKGVIFKVYTEDPLYSLAPVMPGIWEFQLNNMTPELLSLFQRYYAEGQGRAFLTLKPPPFRVIPIQKSIPAELNILSYEQVEGFIDRAGSVALADCHCRAVKRMVGEGCDAPDDVCILLDVWAEYFEKNLNVRKVDKDEAKAALRKAADAGLVHATFNSVEGAMFICNCCGCCCVGLRGITQLKIPVKDLGLATSNFIAEVSKGDCTGCAVCEDRCPVGALALGDAVVEVLVEKCIGCGACVTVCPTSAISMKRRENQTVPVQSGMELLRQVAEERKAGRG